VETACIHDSKIPFILDTQPTVQVYHVCLPLDLFDVVDLLGFSIPIFSDLQIDFVDIGVKVPFVILHTAKDSLNGKGFT